MSCPAPTVTARCCPRNDGCEKPSYHEGRLAAYTGRGRRGERIRAELSMCHSALLGFFWPYVHLAFGTSLFHQAVFYFRIQPAFSRDPTLSLRGVPFLKQSCLWGRRIYHFPLFPPQFPARCRIGVHHMLADCDLAQSSNE